MPIDPKPRPDGTIVLVHTRVGSPPTAKVLSAGELKLARKQHAHLYERGSTDDPEFRLYVSHFASCPNAARHRRHKKAVA